MIYFLDPAILPAPGKCTVKPFKEVLEYRVRRQKKKAELRKKLSQANPEDTNTLAAAVFEIEKLDDLEEKLDEFKFDDVEDQLAADAILAVEPVAAPVEVEQERYRRFIQLLQNFGVDKNRENQSLEIDVIQELICQYGEE